MIEVDFQREPRGLMRKDWTDAEGANSTITSKKVI
jgi:hypothetical protein